MNGEHGRLLELKAELARLQVEHGELVAATAAVAAELRRLADMLTAWPGDDPAGGFG